MSGDPRTRFSPRARAPQRAPGRRFARDASREPRNIPSLYRSEAISKTGGTSAADWFPRKPLKEPHVSHRKQRAGSNRHGDRYGAVAGNAYNENLRDFVASGRVEPAARDARNAVESDEACELHEAEDA